MISRQRIQVQATPEQVWAILRNPRRMSEWSPHCTRCIVEDKQVHAGLRFQIKSHLGGPERQAECEVVECQANRMLVLRFSGEALPRKNGYVDETFLLRPTRGGTKIVLMVDFSHSGIPWFLQAYLKLLSVVGSRESRWPLECLKELAEEGNR